MRELVQQIFIYVIIVSALRGLLLNKKYEEYFRFFSGILMLLILLSPLLKFLGEPSKWYDRLETNLLSMDVEEVKGVLKVSDEQLEKMVEKRYSAVLKEEIKALAKERGIFLSDTEITFRRGKNGMEIREISGRKKTRQTTKKGDNEKGTDTKKEQDRTEVAIETVQIGEQEKAEKKTEDNSKKAEKLKSDICTKFALKKEQVHIWN